MIPKGITTILLLWIIYTHLKFFVYSYCEFSHLTRIAGQLTQFNDYKQYGQLMSRGFGLTVSDGSTLFSCISEGMAGLNGKDFSDVGNCVGQITSQILDAQF